MQYLIRAFQNMRISMKIVALGLLITAAFVATVFAWVIPNVERALVDKKKDKILFQNANYVFREEYNVSEEAEDFFDQEEDAIRQIAEDFAESLISTIMEGF